MDKYQALMGWATRTWTKDVLLHSMSPCNQAMREQSFRS